MSDVPDIVPGDADPQSQPPAGHLEGELAPVGSASSPSRAAPEDTARTPAETPVPGGGERYRTRSHGRPNPYSLGPRDTVVFDEKLLPKGQSEVGWDQLDTHPWLSTWRSAFTPPSESERSRTRPTSEGARPKVGRGGTSLRRTSSQPDQGETVGQAYPIGRWARLAARDIDAHGRDKPADQNRGAELPAPISHDRAAVRETPPSHSAKGISTGLDLQPPEDSIHLESPVRISDGSDSDHLEITDTNKTPKGATAGGLTLEERTNKGVKTGSKDKQEAVGTPSHLSLTKPTDKTNTKTTNPIVQPHRAGGTKSPIPEGGKDKQVQVARKLFKMPDESGPQIRMPWFQGKPEEKVERYFRELERLKIIYEWNEQKTLNMALHGLKGRADDWVQGLGAAGKDTFAHLKASMIEIFGDKRAVWQKQTDFFALRQGKDQTVLDFAGTIKQHQGKADVGPGTVLAVFLEGLKGSIAKQVAIQDPKTFEEAVATATRLESLDRVKPSKVTLNLMGTEQEAEGGQVEGVTMLVEKLGLVLARIESSPWNKGPNRPKEQQSSQPDKGYRQSEGGAKAGQTGDRSKAMAKTSGQNYREGGKSLNQEGKKGTTFEKIPYNPDRFCVAHQSYGHSTDECSWLKARLKEIPPPDKKGKGRENKQQGN